jgi:hypothetical protein
VGSSRSTKDRRSMCYHVLTADDGITLFGSVDRKRIGFYCDCYNILRGALHEIQIVMRLFHIEFIHPVYSIIIIIIIIIKTKT